jgi:hypothetical protein
MPPRNGLLHDHIHFLRAQLRIGLFQQENAYAGIRSRTA